ncbi:winged helix-turn-helix domain-containing protein [Aestuariimicrobium ganziense]|uniref:winged helix-turn-helix domain-containing protein n=1 Tax=Aestuariimicrobium ganziense TaxID=2773677 RepID=UPI0022A76CA8|nr:winged helix-turn-helix domain-containing protein [Aestuariimicrobium ganziense]
MPVVGVGHRERAGQGVPFAKPEILTAVWGAWFGEDHLVEVHISRLRAKIARAGGPQVVATIPGLGYRLADVQPTSSELVCAQA